MLNLFYIKDTTEYPKIENPKLIYIRYMLKMEIDKIKNYYLNRESRVSNDNYLVRIINTMDMDYNINDFDYIREVEIRSEFVSKNFDIVSRKHFGSVLKDNIFKGSREIFILDNDSAVMNIGKDYKSFKSLSLLEFEGRNLNMLCPSEEIEMFFNPLTVFKININNLMLQYKYWANERLKNDMSTNASYFVYKVVLPSLIDEMTDFAILNRVYDLGTVGEVLINVSDKTAHPFLVRDFSKKIDKILMKQIKDVICCSKDTYEQVLNNINLITKDNAYELLFFKNMETNTQVFWSYFLSRIRHYLNLILVTGDLALRHNRDIINDLELSIQKIERTNILFKQLESEFYREMKDKLSDIKELIKG